MNTYKHRKKYEKLYLILYGLYAYFSILDSSLLQINLLMAIIRWATLYIQVLLFAIPYLKEKQSIKRLIISLVVIALFFTASIVTDRSYLVIYALFVILSRDCRIENIIKTSLISALTAIVSILILCKIGVITDYIYQYKAPLTRSAHCYGFSYYSTMPFIVFYCYLMYIYILLKILCGYQY